MTARALLIDAFLACHGWGDARRKPLAGDASSRQYHRLWRDGETAILLDAGEDGGSDMHRFVAVARHLDAIGLSAPHVLATGNKANVLLLEDFNDAIFARVIDADPRQERPLYEAAVDVLIHLRTAPAPADAPAFSAAEMADLTRIAFDWYAPAPAQAVAGLVGTFTDLLRPFGGESPVLSLRDYHSENMIWLPDRKGVRQVGLLDFQDAFLGHPAYDLASLLGDARRDVTPALGPILIDRYLRATGAAPEEFGLAVALYGAQRNLRILGVFARLCAIAGKPHYVDLIPRVWRNLLSDLGHPALGPLRGMVLAHMPEPTPDVLARLKSRCPTARHR